MKGPGEIFHICALYICNNKMLWLKIMYPHTIPRKYRNMSRVSYMDCSWLMESEEGDIEETVAGEERRGEVGKVFE